MTIVRDAAGVPQLSAEDIECLCKRFLEYAAPNVLITPTFTPLAYVFRKLADNNHCTASFDGDLGWDSSGLPILGAYSITRKHITISRTIPKDDLRFPFTCAHELGHFYLHRNVRLGAAQDEGEVEIRDSAQELVTYRVQGGRRTYMEWQANRFAAGILMPQPTVAKGLSRVQGDLGIGRRGRIWLDHQRQSHRDYRSTVSRLADLYKVSAAVVQFRLRELDLVDVDSTYGLIPIGDLIGKALRELFGFR